MPETILLTGATGFLGSHLLEALLAREYQVVILKRSFSNTWRINHLLDRVHSYDVDNVSVEKVFDKHKIDIVNIHFAGPMGVYFSILKKFRRFKFHKKNGEPQRK